MHGHNGSRQELPRSPRLRRSPTRQPHPRQRGVHTYGQSAILQGSAAQGHAESNLSSHTHSSHHSGHPVATMAPLQTLHGNPTHADSSRQWHRNDHPGRHTTAYRGDSSRDGPRHDRMSQSMPTAHANRPAMFQYQQQPVSTMPAAPYVQQQPSQQLTQQHHLPHPPRGPSQHPLSPSSQLPGPPQSCPLPVASSPPLPPPPARPSASNTSAPQAQAPTDPALDFFSEHFDALKALQTKGLQPPVPRMKPLDNVTRCRMILPPELPDSASAWAAAHPKAEPTEDAVRNKELSKQRTAAVLKREQDQAARGNTLDKIAHKFTSGPLLLLRRYYRTSVRLQVATRHASGIRGVATGYLHGFDKFMNLVLMNVDEDYTVMVRVPHDYTVTVHAPAEPQAAEQGGASVMVERQVNKFRWKRKAEKRNRRLHQVFLRGDNIVTIKPVLQDVQKHWSQLVLQWASAGIPTAAFMFQTQAGEPNQTLSLPLPPAPSHSAAVAHLTPAWAHNRR